METLQELKQELLGQITAIEDYNVLLALKEEVALYQTKATAEGPYDFPGATEEEREELIAWDKAEEVDVSDCVSQEDYEKMAHTWLTK
jgi:hypothetical protein